MGLFRTRRTTQSNAESPALLFRDLRRSNEVKFLWGHQERLLEEYQKHLKTPNVALELPTGSGKTLVGLLIAEWRRRVRGERVVYLCPTRQLCNQVKAHADSYGITTSLLIGQQRNYNLQSFTAYQRAEAIAITTYSGLFNTNPRINNPQVIICDDTHAGDEYISSLWSVQFTRKNHPVFFQALVDLLGDAIAEDMRRRIAAQSDDPMERSWVDLVPAPRYHDRISDLADLLDEHTRDTDLTYPWQMIRGRLEVCNIYVSPDSFLIRPCIPPTETHAPFTNADQRIFMSATLGVGGELERITGVRQIERLPIQPGWDKRGTGRRLILFPELLEGDGACGLAVEEVLLTSARTLVLVQENRVVDRFAAEFDNTLTIFRAADVEHSLDDFVKAPGPAALVLANRYEGIDLPGEACRSMVLLDLPMAINLQERFLLERLGAVVQLRDRIRTRLTQGVGRCTRDESDYALVLLVGDDVLNWCATKDNVASLHPELQAEIDFGIENSKKRTLEEFRKLYVAFFSRGEDWVNAEEDIIARRDACERSPDSVTTALAASARHELAYVYALWRHDFDHAHEEAIGVTDALSGGKELKPYRTFWYYAAAAAADLAHRRSNDPRWMASYHNHIEKAVAMAIGVPWLAGLRDLHPSLPVNSTTVTVDAEAISALLTEWHLVGPRFEHQLNTARQNILSAAAKSFETGLATLGKMLGYKARTWNENGAPDGLWILNNDISIVFEAKSDEDEDEPISLKTVRQAGSHANWVRNRNEISPGTTTHTVLITPRTNIRKDAQTSTNDISHATPDAFRDLFARAAEVLNSIRARARSLSEEARRELIIEQYHSARLTQADLIDTLLVHKLRSLPLP